ncbi:hypothetical protein F5Y04DRAFT_46364 [Hypomontagnella monticulosa]|nr:hypothetical protein F5Y04DRAFT_46364 [Hypomontagnella monticulosa]
MPSRKPHRNSHHGCTQCKVKRVKCDEEQPSCARCRNKGRDCSYKHLMSSYNPFRDYNNTGYRPVSPTATPSSQRKRDLPPTPPAPTVPSLQGSPSSTTTLPPLQKELSASDPITAQLLYHYSTEVSSTFTSSDVRVEVLLCFHDAITRHSFGYPYVYYAILAVSALHLASLTSPLELTSQSPSTHVVTALSHKASAIETLRPVINSITSLTCEPALAASGLLTVCAFALLHVGMATDTIDLLAQIMILYRGTVAIFQAGRQDRNASPDATIPKLRQFVVTATSNEKPWPEAEAAVSKVLAKISELSEVSENNEKRKNTLLDAGFKLKTALRRAAAAKGVYNVVCIWLATVHPTFIEAIKARDPFGLILLAHWVIPLGYVKDIWWVRGWPEETIRVVWQEVGNQHPDLMQWVLEEMRNDTDNNQHALTAS